MPSFLLFFAGVIIYGTDYAAYFQVLININKYNIRIIIDSDVTGNFILIKIIKKYRISKRRKISPIEFIIIDEIFIS